MYPLLGESGLQVIFRSSILACVKGCVGVISFELRQVNKSSNRFIES